jgi:hypothetical protein
LPGKLRGEADGVLACVQVGRFNVDKSITGLAGVVMLCDQSGTAEGKGLLPVDVGEGGLLSEKDCSAGKPKGLLLVVTGLFQGAGNDEAASGSL